MKILVIQLRRVGDILLTTPVLPYLKKSFPGATVDFLCEPMGRDVLSGNPFLNQVLIYDKTNRWASIRAVRANSYDVVFDFMNNPSSAYVSFFSGARQTVAVKRGIRSLLYNSSVSAPEKAMYAPELKIQMVQKWLAKKKKPVPPVDRVRPEIYLNGDDDHFAVGWMRTEKILEKSFVVMVPAHRHSIRQWRSEGFRNVGLELARKYNTPVFLAWGPGEESVVSDVQKTDLQILRKLPSTSLRQMAAIFKRARLVVTNDSGAMHVSVSVGAPTVTIYGPTRPVDWNPSFSSLGSQIDLALSADGVECLGCHLDQCPIGHICMLKLGDGTVIKACETILSGGTFNARDKNTTKESGYVG